MPKVRILPDRVANQIAAGEVIERPAAAVKELVENALDAGATRIAVEFAHGGRSLLRVEDNGCGMTREDALLSLQRHATSKILDASDLDRLGTFGFRGEALPSIASISRFTLRTRAPESEAGIEIAVHGGRLAHEKACGRPVGTRIDVEDLFEPVPARRKFLKSDRTEAAHIIECVRLYALACPRTAFTLIEDGREVIRSPECSSLVERVAELFGRRIVAELAAVSAEEPGMRLSGLIGRPGVGRTSRQELIAFVNSRPVDSRTVNQAVIESYHESLPPGRYPVAFVFFDCEPGAVDVNVHPAKREVRFRREPAVRSFILRTLQARLRELGAQAAPAGSFGFGGAGGGGGGNAEEPPPAPYSGYFSTESLAASRSDARVQDAPAASTPSASPSGPPPPSAALRWRYLGLAHGNYALFETASGLVLLDRRAAHERIWFERLSAQFRSGGVPVQRLLLPIALELDAIASALLIDHRDFLHVHGFEIAEFGRHFFRIESAPSWIEPGDTETFLRDLLGAVRDGSLTPSNLDLAREELARLSASKAVRLSSRAGEAEIAALVAELFATATPVASPFGRPTYIELNHGELARRFLAKS